MTETQKRVRKLWAVDIEISASDTIYVIAETQEQAREDAEELVTHFNDWRYETDYYVSDRVNRDKLDGATLIWTGGPDGKDITAKQLDAHLASLEEELSDPPKSEIPGQLSINDLSSDTNVSESE